jgi:hypothetical protein
VASTSVGGKHVRRWQARPSVASTSVSGKHVRQWQARHPAAGKSAVQRERLVAPLGYRSEGEPRLGSASLAVKSCQAFVLSSSWRLIPAFLSPANFLQAAVSGQTNVFLSLSALNRLAAKPPYQFRKYTGQFWENNITR